MISVFEFSGFSETINFLRDYVFFKEMHDNADKLITGSEEYRDKLQEMGRYDFFHYKRIIKVIPRDSYLYLQYNLTNNRSKILK